jgi:hypothetical protein
VRVKIVVQALKRECREKLHRRSCKTQCKILIKNIELNYGAQQRRVGRYHMMDVFTSTPKQTLQMSSFYAVQENLRVQPRSYPKTQFNMYPSSSHKNTSAITHSPNKIDTSVTPLSGIPLPHNSHTVVNTNTPISSATTPKQPVIPSLRKIVKGVISPAYVASAIGVCAFLNTVVCFVVSNNYLSLLSTQWEIFIHLWGLVTTIQLIVHSVYMCTSLTTYISLLHFVAVSLIGILPKHYVSASILWLAPSFCAFTFAYQSILFSFVFSHTKHKWVYITTGAFLVLIPMAKLLQIDVIENENVSTVCALSAISIYTLYIFAAVNGYNASFVDVTVAPSPTWVPE